LIAQWYREMAFKFHPDRDSSHAAMVAINHAHDRLKEMIEG
jgi:curved DNA-binding protein CbpA